MPFRFRAYRRHLEVMRSLKRFSSRSRNASGKSVDQAQAQQPERDVPSVGMFRVPQSVNCSVRRLFGYSLLFCAFLRTK